MQIGELRVGLDDRRVVIELLRVHASMITIIDYQHRPDDQARIVLQRYV